MIAIGTLILASVIALFVFKAYQLFTFYRIERFDPWFWGQYGLGAPQSHRLFHFIRKACTAFVLLLPPNLRQALLDAVKSSGLVPKMAQGHLDFAFDEYDGLVAAPTINQGREKLGMKKLSDWLFWPRYYSIKESEYTHPLMRPILFVPGLKCKPFYGAKCKEFAWKEKFEAATPIIRQEFLELSKKDPKSVATYLVPEDMQSTVSGWRTFFFVNPQGKQMIENQKLCPKTWEILNSIPGFIPENMTMFSVLSPGSEIQSHAGLTNAAVRIHLPLLVPEPTKSVIRVGDKVRTWEEGKLLAFNDAYDHQVWNFGKLTRVVLFFDVWHPDLTKEDLNCIEKGWSKIKESMGGIADEYERMARKKAEEDEEEDWLVTSSAA